MSPNDDSLSAAPLKSPVPDGHYLCRLQECTHFEQQKEGRGDEKPGGYPWVFWPCTCGCSEIMGIRARLGTQRNFSDGKPCPGFEAVLVTPKEG